MKIFNRDPNRLTFGWTVGKHSGPQVQPPIDGLCASFFVKATFRILDNGETVPWPDGPDFPSGDLPWDDAGIRYSSDYVPFKPKGEYIVVGTAYPPEQMGAQRFEAGVKVGAKEKSLTIFGERQWVDSLLGSKPGPAAVATPVSLSYKHAWGGAGYELNPVGVGREGIEMPRIESSSRWVDGRRSDAVPAGFAPIPPEWIQRRSKLGSYGGDWTVTRWPWYPADFDYSYFNAAPPGQWIDGYFRGDEDVVFENLIEDHPTFATRLPGLRARCFLTQTLNWKPDLPEEEFENYFNEVSLDLDTVWLDSDERKLVQVWRGRWPVKSIKLRDVLHLLILVEPLSESGHSLAHYKEMLDERLDPDPPPPVPSETPDFAKLNLEIEQRYVAAVGEVVAGMKAMAEGMKSFASHEQEMASETAKLSAKIVPEMLKATETLDVNPPSLTNAESDKIFDSMAKLVEGAPGVSPETVTSISGAKAYASQINEVEAEEKAVEEELSNAAAEADAEIDSLREEMQFKRPRTVPMTNDGRIDVEECRRSGLWRVDGRGIDFSGLDLSRMDFRQADLTDARFDDCDLSESNFAKAIFSKTSFRNANLTRAIFYDVDLSDSDFTGVRWREVRLFYAILNGQDLRGADFCGARGMNSEFVGANLGDACFAGASLPKSTFTGANVSGADFRNAGLFFTDFRGALACKANFSFADLRTFRGGEKADFAGATIKSAHAAGSTWEQSKLDGVDFQLSDLSGAIFSEASLIDAVFDRCHLVGAIFDDAILRRSIMTNANLLRSNFDRADLSGAQLDFSNLYEAGFWDATLTGATWDYANVRRTRLTL